MYSRRYGSYRMYLEGDSEGKFGLVSYTKLTTEATFMDLFHS